MTDFGSGDDAAHAIAIQDNREFAVVRFNSNGSLDTSFDGDGKVSTAIGPGDDVARAVALQDDDRIVVAGHSGPAEGDNDFALARYYP